ncbi:MAG: redoxin domain-containing protein [Candidatus Bipolaricaulota bacterium]|nr:redoxin domain-containing protein [Candidatus Bipolaricaulota bacterium]
MRQRHTLKTIILVLIILSVIGWLGFANEKPIARFTAATAPEGTGNLTILLDATASQDTDGQISSYQWLFGDGYTGSGITKTHTYRAPGDYQVTLMLFDNEGAGGSTVATITVPITGGAATASTAMRANVPEGTEIGQAAPEFTLQNLNGEEVLLSDFLGNVAILDFWRSTCPACRESLPYLETLRKQYQESGLVVITISLDSTVQAPVRFFLNNGYPDFIKLWDEKSNNLRMVDLYDIPTVPYTFLIDRQGVIRYKGFLNYLREADIEPLL